jgi:hypothetical protein
MFCGVTVKPDTVQIPVVLLVSVTVRPDEAVGERVKVGRYCRVPGLVKVIVWFCFALTPLHDNDDAEIVPMPVDRLYVPRPELYAEAPM